MMAVTEGSRALGCASMARSSCSRTSRRTFRTLRPCTRCMMRRLGRSAGITGPSWKSMPRTGNVSEIALLRRVMWSVSRAMVRRICAVWRQKAVGGGYFAHQCSPRDLNYLAMLSFQQPLAYSQADSTRSTGRRRVGRVSSRLGNSLRTVFRHPLQHPIPVRRSNRRRTHFHCRSPSRDGHLLPSEAD